MPSRIEIANRITGAADVTRREYLKNLHQRTGRDTILYACRPPAMILMDDLQGFMAAQHELKGPNLDLIVHSPGGSSEAAEQIVRYLRSRYEHIRVIVPLQAMSAGTMIACAADEIVLGRQSALGPVDPQFQLPAGAMPAHAIIEEFETALDDVQKNPTKAAFWVSRLSNIPHGQYVVAKTVLARAEELVSEWLLNYMHLSDEISKEAARWFASKEHRVHGKPLMFDEIKQKGLNVHRLEDDNNLQDLVLSIFHATMVTFDITGCIKFTENHKGKGFFQTMPIQFPININPVPNPEIPTPPKPPS
jgi:hypothetical protein